LAGAQLVLLGGLQACLAARRRLRPWFQGSCGRCRVAWRTRTVDCARLGVTQEHVLLIALQEEGDSEDAEDEEADADEAVAEQEVAKRVRQYERSKLRYYYAIVSVCGGGVRQCKGSKLWCYYAIVTAN